MNLGTISEWIPFALPALSAGGLAILGWALLIYAVLPGSRASGLAQIAGVGCLIGAAYLAAQAWGESRYLAGVAAERAVWTQQQAITLAREDAALSAIQSVGDQIASRVTDTIAALPASLAKEIIDAARTEDDKPVPDNCRDVYRGLPPAVLRGLDAIR
ncbi:hypothetical protein FHS55_002618 [Angulomicrobium tetraedrale]|uniref:Uncharacterized protein n=1 Tax=Ancylobacter tetraedralis TaxID=217068 RepID=A0A839ZB88_9HYPH|nr:hypothetical protein [Ancylobacter tetraedralis]MBB3772009.1 hypothetical protein [Ancylobacter tetraedralis]